MAALVCSVIANSVQAFAGSSEGRKTFSPIDFLPDWAGDRPQSSSDSSAQSVEEMKAAFKRIAAAAASDKKKSENPPPQMKKRKPRVAK